VQLDVHAQPELTLPRPERPEQREAIAEAQAELAAAAGAGADVIRDFTTIPYSVIEASAAEVGDLRAAGVIAGAAPDPELRPHLDFSLDQIHAPDVWPSTTGTGQTVAILDTGVQANHQFFTGRIVHQACFAEGTIPQNVGGNCPNGQASQVGGSSGGPCTAQDCDHGTHVAGIAAGDDPADTFDGVARGASIMAIRVFHNVNANTSSAWGSDVLAALQHVYSQRNSFDIAAVNLSLGIGLFTGTCNSFDAGATRAAVANLFTAGIPVVASSGNDGSTTSIGFPSCVSNVISVGNVLTAKSSGNEDRVNASSNASPSLDLLAPGSPIESATIDSTAPRNDTLTKSGTSMAAPHVTGSIALLTEVRSEIDALPANNRVRRIHGLLDASGVCIRDPGNNLWYRRIDIGAAATTTLSPSALFNDVRPCIWYEDAVNWLVFNGLANGYPDNTFRGDNDIIRAEFTNMLWQLFGQPATAHEHTWTDGLPWIENALDWMADPAGPASPSPLANGYPDNTFRPNNAITRGEVANMLWRAAGSPDAGSTPPFSDVPAWLAQAVTWIADDPDDGGTLEPIATGYPDGTFRDRVPVTRAEVARMLQRYDAAVQP
jgi:subtilisin family serine protease